MMKKKNDSALMDAIFMLSIQLWKCKSSKTNPKMQWRENKYE